MTKTLPGRIEQEIAGIRGKDRQRFFRSLVEQWEAERRYNIINKGVLPEYLFTHHALCFLLETGEVDQTGKATTSPALANFKDFECWAKAQDWLEKRPWKGWGVWSSEPDRNPFRSYRNALRVTGDEYMEFKMRWHGNGCVCDESPTFFGGMGRS